MDIVHPKVEAIKALESKTRSRLDSNFVEKAKRSVSPTVVHQTTRNHNTFSPTKIFKISSVASISGTFDSSPEKSQKLKFIYVSTSSEKAHSPQKLPSLRLPLVAHCPRKLPSLRLSSVTHSPRKSLSLRFTSTSKGRSTRMNPLLNPKPLFIVRSKDKISN